jgi:hypothetical protein
MWRFVGIDLGRELVPDETTVCRFRHLFEGLCERRTYMGLFVVKGFCRWAIIR